MFFGLIATLLIYMLYVEYSINVPHMAMELIKSLLDPGPIQREAAIPIVPIVEQYDAGENDESMIQAAVQAVKARMGTS